MEPNKDVIDKKVQQGQDGSTTDKKGEGTVPENTVPVTVAIGKVVEVSVGSEEKRLEQLKQREAEVRAKMGIELGKNNDPSSGKVELEIPNAQAKSVVPSSEANLFTFSSGGNNKLTYSLYESVSVLTQSTKMKLKVGCVLSFASEKLRIRAIYSKSSKTSEEHYYCLCSSIFGSDKAVDPAELAEKKLPLPKKFTEEDITEDSLSADFNLEHSREAVTIKFKKPAATGSGGLFDSPVVQGGKRETALLSDKISSLETKLDKLLASEKQPKIEKCHSCKELQEFFIPSASSGRKSNKDSALVVVLRKEFEKSVEDIKKAIEVAAPEVAKDPVAATQLVQEKVFDKLKSLKAMMKVQEQSLRELKLFVVQQRSGSSNVVNDVDYSNPQLMGKKVSDAEAAVEPKQKMARIAPQPPKAPKAKAKAKEIGQKLTSNLIQEKKQKFCPSCGSLRALGKFCGNCGEAFTEED